MKKKNILYFSVVHLFEMSFEKFFADNVLCSNTHSDFAWMQNVYKNILKINFCKPLRLIQV